MIIKDYPYDEEAIRQRIECYLKLGNPYMDEQKTYRFILNCIDLTTLEGSDNKAVVENLCQRALDFRDDTRNIPSTAAVCVYPPFVSLAKSYLKDSGVRVASVSGAFPAGQSPIEIKLAEVRYALEQGADEIDMVISRGKFLEGNLEEVYEEIRAIRELCAEATLKVILETGELKTPQNIYSASMLAMSAGADFIKTSTGKISVNATPEAFVVMMDAIRDYYEQTGRMVSIKPAGGISDPDTAKDFVALLANVLGEKWLSNQTFRIGASRLANKVLDKIE